MGEGQELDGRQEREAAPAVGEELTSAAEPEPPKEPVVSPVTFNAVKHGIFSVSPVVPWFENEEDWYAFRDSIFESLRPRGGLEMALVDRVAVLLWRMMRVVRYERECVAADLSKVGRDLQIAMQYGREKIPQELTPEIKERMDRMGLGRLVPDAQTVDKIMRYEGRLFRQLVQTLKQLSLLQGARYEGGLATMGLRNPTPPDLPSPN